MNKKNKPLRLSNDQNRLIWEMAIMKCHQPTVKKFKSLGFDIINESIDAINEILDSFSVSWILFFPSAIFEETIFAVLMSDVVAVNLYLRMKIKIIEKSLNKEK